MKFLGVRPLQLRSPARDAASLTADRTLDFGFAVALTDHVHVLGVAGHGSCLSGARRPFLSMDMQRLNRNAADRCASGLTALRGGSAYAGTARPLRNERKQIVQVASLPSTWHEAAEFVTTATRCQDEFRCALPSSCWL